MVQAEVGQQVQHACSYSLHECLSCNKVDLDLRDKGGSLLTNRCRSSTMTQQSAAYTARHVAKVPFQRAGICARTCLARFRQACPHKQGTHTHIAQLPLFCLLSVLPCRAGASPSFPQQLLPGRAHAPLGPLLCLQGCLQAVHPRVDAQCVAMHVEAREAHCNQASDLGTGPRAGLCEWVRLCAGLCSLTVHSQEQGESESQLSDQTARVKV